jgi:hypothetical protein
MQVEVIVRIQRDRDAFVFLAVAIVVEAIANFARLRVDVRFEILTVWATQQRRVFRIALSVAALVAKEAVAIFVDLAVGGGFAVFVVVVLVADFDVAWVAHAIKVIAVQAKGLTVLIHALHIEVAIVVLVWGKRAALFGRFDAHVFSACDSVIATDGLTRNAHVIEAFLFTVAERAVVALRVHIAVFRGWHFGVRVGTGLVLPCRRAPRRVSTRGEEDTDKQA